MEPVRFVEMPLFVQYYTVKLFSTQQSTSLSPVCIAVCLYLSLPNLIIGID